MVQNLAISKSNCSDQALEKILIFQDWGNSKSLPLDTKWSFILSRLVNNGILGKWAEIKNGQSLHFKVNKMGQKVKKVLIFEKW